jgi:hypothetical protein
MENKETINTIVRSDQADFAVEALLDVVRLLNSAAKEDTVTGMRGVIAVAIFQAAEAASRIKKMDGMLI